jgi:hypothetical protein
MLGRTVPPNKELREFFIKKKKRVWNLSKGVGGQTPNLNFLGIYFGSIEVIDTYFWIQTLRGRRGSTKSIG